MLLALPALPRRGLALSASSPAERAWPLFGLAVRTSRLELRYADDRLAVALADLAAEGLHDPATMPFFVPWTDVEPEQQRQNTLRYHWRNRAEVGPGHFALLFAVLEHGEPVGSLDVAADDLASSGTAHTGSWVAQAQQGRGLGRELREAALHLIFEGLGARWATTAAFADNGRSLGVTRRLGYEPVGHEVVERRGAPATVLRFRMAEEHWRRHLRRDDVELVGWEPCRPLLGLA